MWNFKEFKSYKQQMKWIDKNEHKYQIQIIYINNSYGVEYKKLKVIDIL
jgi:hypothetical protein